MSDSTQNTPSLNMDGDVDNDSAHRTPICSKYNYQTWEYFFHRLLDSKISSW